MSASLELKRPSLDLYLAFKKFFYEMSFHEEVQWDPYIPKPGDSPKDFIDRLNLRETEIDGDMVTENVYWAMVDGNMVGRISLRHYLKGNLFKIGGHIGYEVSPMHRRKGYATEMLRLVLNEPKAREIGRLLLTCSPSNPASNKTILKNGGVLEKTVFVDLVGEDRNHYWIDLAAASKV